MLAQLVDLGVVERRDVPPSSLFQLVRQHVAVSPLLALARARDALIGEMGRLASGVPLVPVSVIVFGSFTRGEADIDSDIAFLVRALSYTDNGGGDLFVDDDGSIFEASIDKLATAGVMRGCNPPVNDRFCPGSNVTRGQMAAFLHRALG